MALNHESGAQVVTFGEITVDKTICRYCPIMCYVLWHLYYVYVRCIAVFSIKFVLDLSPVCVAISLVRERPGRPPPLAPTYTPKTLSDLCWPKSLVLFWMEKTGDWCVGYQYCTWVYRLYILYFVHIHCSGLLFTISRILDESEHTSM